MKVFKYRIELCDFPEVSMPKGARPLAFGLQNDVLTLWAIVDPDGYPIVTHRFRLVGTGHEIDLEETESYVGTVLDHQGHFVWHLFYLGDTSQR